MPCWRYFKKQRHNLNKNSDKTESRLWFAITGNKKILGQCIQACKRIIINIKYIKNMNAKGRKEIAKYVTTLEEIKNNLENMRDEEEDKLYNMPEGLQDSERGEQMQESIDTLEDACNSIDEAIDSLNEI